MNKLHGLYKCQIPILVLLTLGKSNEKSKDLFINFFVMFYKSILIPKCI